MRLFEIFEEIQNDSVIIHGYVSRTTDKAYFIHLYGTEIKEWFPKSLMKPISIRPSREEEDNKYTKIHTDENFRVIIGFKVPRNWFLRNKSSIGLHNIHQWKQVERTHGYNDDDHRDLMIMIKEAETIMNNVLPQLSKQTSSKSES